MTSMNDLRNDPDNRPSERRDHSQNGEAMRCIVCILVL